MSIYDFDELLREAGGGCTPGRRRLGGEANRHPVALALSWLAMLAAVCAFCPAAAHEAITPHLAVGSLAQYLILDERAEVALARSAAPDSIARNAEVLILRASGFRTAVKGCNGFVCMVARFWTSAADADFWGPKVQVPMCFNAAAARLYLRYYLRRTDAVLGGQSKEEVAATIASAMYDGQLPAVELGAMCYMLSKEGYGGDTLPHWPPHLMFFYPATDAASWGANLPGSPGVCRHGRR